MKHFLFLICLIPTLLFGQYRPAKVLAVHDGDSFRVQYEDGTKEWVRLEGVDCPEVISNHISKNQAFGLQAATFVRDWIKGDTLLVDSLTTDLYGRTIVSALTKDSVNISEYLVTNGYAWYLDKNYRTLQEQAKDSKLGLWGLPGRKLRPATFRQNNRY